MFHFSPMHHKHTMIQTACLGVNNSHLSIWTSNLYFFPCTVYSVFQSQRYSSKKKNKEQTNDSLILGNEKSEAHFRGCLLRKSSRSLSEISWNRGKGPKNGSDSWKGRGIPWRAMRKKHLLLQEPTVCFTYFCHIGSLQIMTIILI